MRKSFFGITMAAFVALAAFATSAKADTILVYSDLPPVAVGGGEYQWSYDIDLAGRSTIRDNDFFVLFDIAGYVPGSAQIVSMTNLAGWSVVEEQYTNVTGATLPVSFSDGGRINLRFWYDIDVLNSAIDNPTTNQISLGRITFKSIYQYVVEGDYASKDRALSAAGVEGSSQFTFNRTDIPAAPLPAAAWAGMALLGALGAARVRRSMKA